MDSLALACVLVLAVLHASWNILLKTAGDPLRTATFGMLTASAVLLPAASVGWWLAGQPAIPLQGWVLGVISGLVEVAYFVFLAAAYRRGDLSVVSPLARGSAPLLMVAVGVGLLGERLAPPSFAGVGILLAGLLTIQRPWRLLRGSHAAHRGAAGFALLTGLMIATYTSIDRVGSQLMAPWLYVAILWGVGAGGLAVVGWLRPRIAGGMFAPPPMPFSVGKAVVGGLMTLGAYLLVLFALSRAEVSLVGPLRESSVLLTSAWGILRLREAAGRREIAIRLVGSLMVLTGVLTLAIAG